MARIRRIVGTPSCKLTQLGVGGLNPSLRIATVSVCLDFQ
jgi:hypothetical protein